MLRCYQWSNLIFLLILGWSYAECQVLRAGITHLSRMNLTGASCEEDLQVFLGKLSLEQLDTTLPMVGDYFQEADGLCRFTPLVPFSFATDYTILHGGKVQHLYYAPPMHLSSPRVTNIYPSDSILPQNILKFQLEFSKPMTAQAYDNIRLEDETGNIIDRAFLNDIPELWDPEKKILTVWLEPGRIKKGLGPSDTLGPILEADHYYRLVIEPGLSSLEGGEMEYAKEKVFRAGELLQDVIDPYKWDIEYPAVGSFRPLKVIMGKPLDYHTIIAKISIDKEGQEIDGRFRAIENEHAFYFFPIEAWRPGDYEIILDPEAEDVAGNRFDRTFEIHLSSEKKDSYRNRIAFQLSK